MKKNMFFGFFKKFSSGLFLSSIVHNGNWIKRTLHHRARPLRPVKTTQVLAVCSLMESMHEHTHPYTHTHIHTDTSKNRQTYLATTLTIVPDAIHTTHMKWCTIFNQPTTESQQLRGVMASWVHPKNILWFVPSQMLVSPYALQFVGLTT